MLGSEYPDTVDSFTMPNQGFLASATFAQVMAIVEATQRAGGQGLGDLTDIGNLTDNTFLMQMKRMLRVDFGEETFNTGVGTLIASANQGTRKIQVSFNTYGGSTVFSNASKIRIFVTEAGSQINAKTIPLVLGNRKDSGDIVETSISTTGFSWRHDNTDRIGTITWLAIQWGE